MRIALLANLESNAPTWQGMPADQWDDLDTPRSVNGILGALRSGGHEAELLEATLQPPHNLIQRLEQFQPDLCFNIAEGHFGTGREAQIPALLDMLRIPYTGSGVLTLALTLDKPMTKRVLLHHGLPTPEFQVLHHADQPLDPAFLAPDGSLRVPLFVKPASEGSSMGVSAQSIVRTPEELRAQVRALLDRYHQPVLCERYIAGREIMIGMVGNPDVATPCLAYETSRYDAIPAGLTVFPPQEADLDFYAETEAGLYTNRIKTEFAGDFRYLCPAPLSPAQEQELCLMAAMVFCVTGCHDFARVDFRLDANQHDQPYILEVNPLPGLSPGISDLCLQANAAEWSYERLINTIVDVAVARYQLAAQHT
ncbi:MAG: hypothetical protein GYB65_08335 [Chloroflexi bacterium]|nr:hypothetical protein [Chloroflexota bacterium]